MYDTRRLFEICAATDTVLYSRVAAEEGETAGNDWEGYVRRLAGHVEQTGARCVLRPLVYPSDREQCAAMQELWHEMTV
jgi:hypothetical protein